MYSQTSAFHPVITIIAPVITLKVYLACSKNNEENKISVRSHTFARVYACVGVSVRYGAGWINKTQQNTLLVTAHLGATLMWAENGN